MNVLLLGNGFDIHYKLPTQYANFLHTVDFLLKNDTDDIKNIGSIFSNSWLQSEDKYIKDCYEQHKTTYDNTLIDIRQINELKEICKDNLWFGYLIKSFNKNIGWIDFEREIANVISAFEKTLHPDFVYRYPSGKIILKLQKLDKRIQYIINFFNFFINVEESKNYQPRECRVIKDEYCMEYPLFSSNIVVNQQKIIDKLWNELDKLAKALKIYLQCFVESTFDLLHKDGTCKRIELLAKTNKAITFNYTNTFERLYFNQQPFHIHGNTNNEIILGVNSNDADELGKVDTAFISFKKYFQRVMLETDFDYFQWFLDIKERNVRYRLITMGHSLDETDKDILEELFSCAYEIIILYHNKEAKLSYIKNLVKIFGKEGFEFLRKNKKLSFLPTNSDFTELVEKFESEDFGNFVQTLTF